MLNIGVFCSSLDGEKIFSEKTKELGAVIAKENYSLVYGGGKLGLMGDLAKSVKENGSAGYFSHSKLLKQTQYYL